MYHFLHRGADLLARIMAYSGGAVLLAVIVMTCASIIGRASIPLGLRPVPGDFEMVEIGVGFAIFAFLPWCQLQRGHVAVDLFRPAFGEVANRLIDVVVDILILGLAIMIAWRLFEGMLDKRQFAETTFILRLPIWQAYLAGLAGAGSFVLVAALCALRSLRTLKNGARDVKP